MILIVIGLVFIFFLSGTVRYCVLHLPTILYWGIRDVFYYFYHKEYNRCSEFGVIRCNVAGGSQVFGCGKTLSLVKRAVDVYNTYDGRTVWSARENTFTTQHIHIISNVSLYGVPYIPWEGEWQFTELDKYGFGPEDITIFLLDESGAVFNSRNFRSNLSTEFLTKLLQSRKNKMALYTTSQRFAFNDKLLREATSLVTTCEKHWRIIRLADYDAYEVENCTNTNMLTPVRVRYWLCKDKDYNSYDTLQLVEKLRKDNEAGNLLGTEEIIATRGGEVAGKEFVRHLKKKYRK